MIRKSIDIALNNRLLVLGGALVLFVWGIISFHNLPIEAYPDVADTYAQIIEGQAELVIDKVSHLLLTGQGIIIPAHSPNFIKPNGRFMMILTVIKSGYED